MKKFIIAFFICFSLVGINDVHASFNSTIIQNELLSLTNSVRSSSVQFLPSLKKSSSQRAKEITKKLSHTRPNSKKWNTTIAHYKSYYCGENISKLTIQYKTSYTDKEYKAIAKLFHKSFMNSPNHKKVLTNSRYHYVYFSINTVKSNKKLYIYLVAHFRS